MLLLLVMMTAFVWKRMIVILYISTLDGKHKECMVMRWRKTHLATEVFHRAIFTSSQVMLLSKAIFRLRRYVSFKLLLQNAAYIFKLNAISYSMNFQNDSFHCWFNRFMKFFFIIYDHVKYKSKIRYIKWFRY